MIRGGTSSGLPLNAKGTTTNDNAAAGYVGEYISATIATGSSVSLTSTTVANVTSISLTAGDWDVRGVVDFSFGATTSVTDLLCGLSSTSATLGPQDTFCSNPFAAMVPTATNDAAIDTPLVRFSLAATTTIYLIARGTFTVSTLNAYGSIQARRVR